jgi:Leu/Phe-tRNA-protein transferase
MSTPHLMSLGAKMIPRLEFTEVLGAHVSQPFQPGLWNADTLSTGNEALPANV